MSEVEGVRHLPKGITEEAFGLFLTQPPNDVNSVVESSKRLQEARQQSVLCASFPREPTTQVFQETAPCVPTREDRRSLIREVVRDRLRQYLSSSSYFISRRAPPEHHL